MPELTPFQQAYLVTFKLFSPNEAPSPLEKAAYEKGANYHGTFSTEESLEVFRPVFFTAITWALLEEKPLPLFIPKLKLTWVMDQTRSLCRGAVKNRVECKELIQKALTCLQTSQAPWVHRSEPPRWVTYGYEKDPVLMPGWFLEGV